MPKATIYDVARLAGVSTATVSKVINGTGRISKDTSVRVESAMAELRYRPSILASALKKHQTFSLGLLVPDITNPFYGELARAVEDEALHQNYSVLVCSTDNRPEREEKQIDLLMRKHLDGLIIATSEGMNKDALDMLLQHEARVIFIDRVLPNSPYPVIATDHYLGSYQATEHLIELGHRKLAIFMEPPYLRSALERLRGFSAALEAHNIALDHPLVFSDGFGSAAGYELAERLLQRKELPTAIFATTDLIAVGALQKFHEAGISIPEDISLIGYDDIQIAQLVSPPLTTVAQPIDEMCKLAVNHLLDNQSSTQTTILLPPQLVIRASSAPPTR